MYSPAHYKEERQNLIFQIMRDHSFATVITPSSEGLSISHLPLLLEITDAGPVLLGHCAKANPQWRQFSSGQMLTAIFHGPHSYISPAWYEPKPDNVPTWNYATVHVQAVASLISNPADVFRVLQKLVQHFETEYATGWSLPAEPNPELTRLLGQIVAFRLDVKDIQAKFKLSQKQSSIDRDNVIANLSQMKPAQREVSVLMREVRKDS